MLRKIGLKSFNTETKQYFDSDIVVADEKDRVVLKYTCGDLFFETEDEYPFFALESLRLKLDKLNFRILCNGSRTDVYPSGMSAIGFLAYVHIIGKPAIKTVDIFGSCNNIEKIGTVEDQKEFRKGWIKSLGLP